MDRKQQLEMSLNILGINVESGKLTQEVYLQQMRNKIVEEKEIAKNFLSQGKRDWAALALKRAKIMEAEITATLEQ
jgi:hypothetical protein